MAEHNENAHEEGEELTFHSIKEFVAHLREHIGDSSEPAVQTYLHDLEYIGGFTDYMRDTPATEVWHNTALGEIIGGEAPAMLAAMVDNPIEFLVRPEILVDKLQVLLEMWFIIGYMAGEGPDHIHKCTELHKAQVVDPAQN
jgi:hypothetical protein